VADRPRRAALQRPYTQDYIDGMFGGFRELHGDRAYATILPSSVALRASTANLHGDRHRKGVTPGKPSHFGMLRPDISRCSPHEARGEVWLPLFTFVDTPGAYPGIGAEERGSPATGAPMRWRACAFRSSP
jgi:acetyl-CoA carboxylase carboxyl transferase subunit alpha